MIDYEKSCTDRKWSKREGLKIRVHSVSDPKNGAKEIAFSMWKTNKLTPFGVYKLVLSHIQMKETE